MRQAIVLLSVAAAAIPAVALADAGLNARVAQVDTSRYPEVTIYVGVTDGADAPVGGLSQGAFRVTEDGQPVEVIGFAGGGGGFVQAALVIDRSGSMEGADKLDGAQQAARAFVQAMRPGDQTALIGFSEEARLLQPFTGDADALDEAIDELEAEGGTALYDAVVAGVDALKGQAGRRALLVLTDGEDCREIGCDGFPGSRHSLGAAIEYARQAGQPVYVVGLGEPSGDDHDGIDEGVLRQIASASGGEYFYAPDADRLADLYAHLAGGIHEEYLLTYRSPRPFYDGTRRAIGVAVAGAAPTSGAYVERHLIDVRSHPLVGLALLAPVLLALALPSLLGRRILRTPPSLHTPASPTFAQASAGAALPVQIITLDDGPRCQACDAALRSSARFCSRCGARRADA